MIICDVEYSFLSRLLTRLPTPFAISKHIARFSLRPSSRFCGRSKWKSSSYLRLIVEKTPV